MKMKIDLPSETQELLKQHASIVNSSENKLYYFLPYWFEKIDGDSFIMHHLDNDLPIDLASYIESRREDTV